MKAMQARGNEFGKLLDDHLVQLNSVEVAFKGHVAEGFTNVEKELQHIKTVVTSAHTSTGKLSEMGASSVQATLDQFKAAMGAETLVFRGELGAMKAEVSGVKVHVMAAAAVAAKNCNYEHLDALAERVHLLTTVGRSLCPSCQCRSGARTMVGVHAGAKSHPPMRQPPGVHGDYGAGG